MAAAHTFGKLLGFSGMGQKETNFNLEIKKIAWLYTLRYYKSVERFSFHISPSKLVLKILKVIWNDKNAK